VYFFRDRRKRVRAKLTPTRAILLLVAIGGMLIAPFFMSSELNEAEQNAYQSVEMLDIEKLIREMRQPKVPATLLFVYTSWCPYCKHTTPLIAEVAKSWAPHGVRVVMVSVDDRRDKLAKYLAEHPLPVPAYAAPKSYAMVLDKALAKYFNAKFKGGIPYLLLVNGEGIKVWEHTGTVDGPTLQQKVQPLLGKKTQ
jgi:thiol-disulfide isomerase/thioredoxin